MNFSDRLALDLVTLTLQLQRVGAGLAAKYAIEFARIQRSLEHRIALLPPGARRRDMNALLIQTRVYLGKRSKALAEQAVKDLSKIAKSAVRYDAVSLNSAIGANVFIPSFDSNLMIAALSGKAIMGNSTVAAYFEAETRAFMSAFTSIVTEGRALSLTNGEILRSLKADPLIARYPISRVKTYMRSAVMTMSNMARMAMYRKNTDMLKGFEWFSTLDSVTSHICKALDGLLWDLEYQPIGHDKSYPGAIAHPNCRSTQLPILKSFDELSGKTQTKLRRIKDSTRASMDGQVSGGLKFEDFMANKSKKFQLEVLGRSRYDLWRTGKLTDLRVLTDMNNNPLTVSQLVAKLGVGP